MMPRQTRQMRPKQSRRMYYWIVAQEEDGQRFLIWGSDRSSDEARQKGLEEGLVEFEIKTFPTRDITAASRMMKHGILEKTHDIKKSTRRLGHTKSLRRKTGRAPAQEEQNGRGIFG